MEYKPFPGKIKKLPPINVQKYIIEEDGKIKRIKHQSMVQVDNVTKMYYVYA
jgi:hypothetical protein